MTNKQHFSAAIDKILAFPEERNEGFRVGAIGETGSGKTTFIKRVMFEALTRGISERAFIHDTKGIIPEVPESIQRQNVQDFVSRGGFQEDDPPMCSFRGNILQDQDCPVEEVAAFVYNAVRKGRISHAPPEQRRLRTPVPGMPENWDLMPLLLYIDELGEAASGKLQKGWASDSTRDMFKKGRKIGGSILWTTQNLKACPSDACDQSSHMAMFRSTSGARNYLKNVIEPDDAMVATAEDLPKLQFVLWEKERGWDGITYEIPVSIFAGKKHVDEEREENEEPTDPNDNSGTRNQEPSNSEG